MAQAKRAAAKATSRATMEAQMLEIISRGTMPQRYKTSVGQFIRAPGGRQIRLQGIDDKLTPEGRAYWRLLGVPAPSIFFCVVNSTASLQYHWNNMCLHWDKVAVKSHEVIFARGPGQQTKTTPKDFTTKANSQCNGMLCGQRKARGSSFATEANQQGRPPPGNNCKGNH